MASDNIGKVFERDFQEALNTLKATGELRYMRLYDSHSANNLLPAQPADYFIGCKGKGGFWELKASRIHGSLVGCLRDALDAHQAAELRLWKRAGFDTYVLFYAVSLGVIEAWRGDVVGKAHAEKSKLPADGLLVTYSGVHSKADLKKVVQQLFPEVNV